MCNFKKELLAHKLTYHVHNEYFCKDKFLYYSFDYNEEIFNFESL